MSVSAKNSLKKQLLVFGVSLLASVALMCICFATQASAAPTMTVDLGTGDATGGVGTLEILFLFALLSLAPSLLIMMTSFTRIIIVLSFLRNALGTQQSPSNQILTGLALFLTIFIMFPVFSQIQTEAYKPYKDGTISEQVAVERAVKPIKEFMIKQTHEEDINLFLSIAHRASDVPPPVIDTTDLESIGQLGLEIIIPSFMTSEIKRAFIMGFLLFIPFLIIDIVVASTLMSMGMVMLPPSMISLPFKIMMFVMVDGWGLLFGTLVKSFGT